jgi:hypothetical protein
MRIFEEGRKNREMILRLNKNNDGSCIDIDIVNSEGLYICTMASIMDGRLNVLGGFKKRLQEHNIDSEELYFNEDGSILVNVL